MERERERKQRVGRTVPLSEAPSPLPSWDAELSFCWKRLEKKPGLAEAEAEAEGEGEGEGEGTPLIISFSY